ncbi:hypothetical protein HMPREF1979_01693 [Actinomyces johnsonii F0542]|uniref:Uncharacterized protein n=1 Tax=Actinomyces johnsonii F0542 TaxID=1321818 RepID=U1QQ26_9ACTO|nr:hypothetical protein HMPREF1979_01693 [Actinomyces johnsonii F0542]
MMPSVDDINASTYSLTDIPIKGRGRTVRLNPSDPPRAGASSTCSLGRRWVVVHR